jgi:fibronectin type 3 domain-containing protein
MNWKDSIPPLAPQELTVTELAPNVFGLQWTPPAEARDGDGARYYVIYRWTSARIPFDNPRAIAAVTTDNRSSYIDTVRVPTGLSYYYAVTAFDKGNNESPPSNVSAGTMKELSAIRGILEVTGLSIQVSNTTQKPTLIAYRLARRSRVSVDVLSIKPAGSDTLVRSIVNEVQEGGTYVFGLNGIPFPRGKHTLRLNTGESHLEQSVDVP